MFGASGTAVRDDQGGFARGNGGAEAEELVVELLRGGAIVVVGGVGVGGAEGAGADARSGFEGGPGWVGEGVFEGGTEGFEVVGGRGEGEVGEAVGVARGVEMLAGVWSSERMS